MGFECGIFTLSKIDDLNAKQILATLQYKNYLNRLSSSWYQEQIKNGHEFSFEEMSSFTLADLPYLKLKEIMNKIPDGIDNEEDPIFYFCSIGQNLDHLIRYFIKKENDALDEEKNYFELSKVDLDEIRKKAIENLTTIKSINFTLKGAWKDNKDISIDGIWGEDTETGEKIDICIDSILTYYDNVFDVDERYLWEKMIEEIDKLNHKDLENNFIIYYRSW